MGDLGLGNSMGDFLVQARGWADDGDACIGVEAVEDSTSGDLRRSLSAHDNLVAGWLQSAYFTSAHHEDLFVLDLPC